MKVLPLVLIPLLTFSLVPGVGAGTSGIAGVSPRHFYVNAGLGAVFSNSSSRVISDSNSVLYSPTSIGSSLFSLPDINWQNQFKNGYGINLAIGSYFNPYWHGNVEFLYQNIQRDTFGTYGWLERNSLNGATYASQNNNPISRIATRADIYSFLSNATYDFSRFKAMNPFIGVGAGVAWLRSDSTQTNNAINIDDPATPLVETAPARQNSPSLSGTAFAWQIKAGINYALSDLATAILQYRLFATTSFQGSQSSIITNPGMDGQTTFYAGQHDIKGLLTHAVELNFRFNV